MLDCIDMLDSFNKDNSPAIGVDLRASCRACAYGGSLLPRFRFGAGSRRLPADSAGATFRLILVKYRLMDLFAGCRGMTAGFLATGRFEVARAVESDEDAARTYAANFGDAHLHVGRIEDVEEFPGVDVVVGGPPCQGFSALNRQPETTVSRGLWREYLRALRSAVPRAFV